ncbi:hypothetical protein EJD97_016769 [Solanum chilense]|uniref:Uncharacterized protein n=1 Tax=Solanum chilense TaxID=4083 RepID=A0A6N2CAR9_SOLCI|nr:hypothetical protein EJD97_016769 [Solanum chilense]
MFFLLVYVACEIKLGPNLDSMLAFLSLLKTHYLLSHTSPITATSVRLEIENNKYHKAENYLYTLFIQ